MTTVVGIRFKDSGKVYFFDPRDLELCQGDMVIVETVRGPEMAKVAYERHDVAEGEIVGELKPVVRPAEPSDFERMRLLHERHEEVLARCADKVREHNLPMSLVKAEYSFDGSRLTFYFTSEKRVDFRMLVRDLARTFKSRIELRQIGPRDEAKLLGGIGPCGRLLCCATFLPDYARVSIKMAKDQDLPLNPSKISGVCGRLLCCLSYEHEQYVEMRAELPRKGTWVQTPDGPGEVVVVNVLKQTVTVQLASSGMLDNYTPAQVQMATSQVHAVARSRAQEGITPSSYGEEEGVDVDALFYDDEDDTVADRSLAHGVKQHEVMDTLAWLEEGAASSLDEGETRRKGARSSRSRQSRKNTQQTAEKASGRHGNSDTLSGQAQSREPSASGGSRRKSRRSRSQRDETHASDAPSSGSVSARQSGSKKVVSEGQAEQRSHEEPAPQKTTRRRRARKKRGSNSDE